MRASLDIFTTQTFNKDRNIGYLKLDSIPTTSMPNSFDEDRRYYLNNLLKIESDNSPAYNGLYFIAQSVLYLDDRHYFGIELVVEKYKESNAPYLYLKGVITYIKTTENFIKIKLTGI